MDKVSRESKLNENKKSFKPSIADKDLYSLRKVFTDSSDTDSRLKELQRLTSNEFVEQLIHKFRNNQKFNLNKEEQSELRCIFCAQIFQDLLKNNWDIEVGIDNFFLNNAKSREFLEEKEVLSQKDQIRNSHLNVRNAVIGRNETQKFIEMMEKPRTFKGKKYSILDLIDDGKDLLNAINEVQKSDDPEDVYKKVIKPEIIPVYTKDQKDKIISCPITGLKYRDIWRYFRLTWSTEYLSRPAREFPIIIRNAARPNKPVIGIAMLSSTALGNETRDVSIGWQSIDQIRSQVIAGHVKIQEVTESLLKVVDDSINEVYKKDFKFLTKKMIASPTDEIIKMLDEIYSQAQKDRASELENSILDDDQEINDQKSPDYKVIVKTPLIVRKRAALLSRLLKVRHIFNQVDLKNNPARAFAELTQKVTTKAGSKVGFEYIKGGKNALKLALTELRLRRNNINIMELSTCGSIAPYNYLLGGKLVTLLMSSKEVHQFVNDRYQDSTVIIRSKMAGKEIKSSMDLKVITTTSLYGNSSQYNRLKITSRNFNELNVNQKDKPLQKSIEWREAKDFEGKSYTGGMGTYHFSSKTALLAQILTMVEKKYREVNSIMGEGTSPKLRLMREAIQFITPSKTDKKSIAPDDFLTHGAMRKNYIFCNDEHILSSLINDRKTRSYKLAKAKDIARFWISKWMIKGLKNKSTQVKEFRPDNISKELRSHKIDDGNNLEDISGQLSFLS